MAGISGKVIGRYYTDPSISALLSNPNATSMNNNPGAMIADSAIETSAGFVASTSGSADSSQLDTDTSKPGVSFTPSALQKKLLRLRCLDANKKPIVSAGRDVWAIQSDEGIPKLYFFTGELSAAATPYTMNQDFYVVYPKTTQFGAQGAADGFPEFIEQADAVIGNNAITQAMLQDNIIGNAEMADDAVGSAEIAAGAVDFAELGIDWDVMVVAGGRNGQSTDTIESSRTVPAGMEAQVEIVFGEGQRAINCSATGETSNATNEFTVSGGTVTYGAALEADAVRIEIKYPFLKA